MSDQPTGKPTGKPPTSSGSRPPRPRPTGTSKVPPTAPTTEVGGIPWKPLAVIAAVIAVAVVGTLLVLRPGSGGGGGGTGDTTPCPTKQPPAMPAGETRTVTMNTEKGTITIKLEADLSPIAVGNFAALVECQFYDGIGFHRTAALDADTPFVIQGGDPTGTGSGGPGYTIQDEAVTAPYGRGVVAMARSSQPELGRVAVLHRPVRPGARRARQLQHVPDHRPRHVGDGGRRRDLRRVERGRAAQAGREDDHGHDRQPLSHPRTEERGTMTTATIATDLGDIEVELYDQSAPKAAANFIALAKKGFYDDVVFHRVIPGFVAQAGDGEHGKKSSLNKGRVGTGGPGYKFEDEPVQGDYVRGALAMANAGSEHQRQPVLHLPPGPDRQAPQAVHAVRPGDQGDGRRRQDRRRAARQPGPARMTPSR